MSSTLFVMCLPFRVVPGVLEAYAMSPAHTFRREPRKARRINSPCRGEMGGVWHVQISALKTVFSSGYVCVQSTSRAFKTAYDRVCVVTRKVLWKENVELFEEQRVFRSQLQCINQFWHQTVNKVCEISRLRDVKRHKYAFIIFARGCLSLIHI